MADNQIQDPIRPAYVPMNPLPQAPDIQALMVGGTSKQAPLPPAKEGLFTGGTTPLSTLDNTGRYPVFFRGIDNEEAYAQGQTAWNKFTRDTLKLGGLATTTFVDGTVGTVYGIFKAIEDGKFSSFYNNEVTRSMDEFNKNLENQFANYYTKKELNAEWYEPANLLTANFWLDKVYKNLGFAIGAIGSGMAWTKGIRALGLFSKIASVGNAAKGAAIAEEAAMAAPAAQRLSAVESGLAKVAKDFAGQYSIRNAAQRATQSLIMTSGEAAIEALDGMNRFRTELINQYIQENGERPEGDDLNKINSLAESVGNTRFVLNTALLSATNYIQLPKIIGSSYKAEKKLFNDLVQPINKITKNAEGKYIPVEKSVGRKIWDGRKFVFSSSEAFEEGMQGAIDYGTNNYWNKKYSGEDASFVDDVLIKGIGHTLTSKEGIESILIGGLSGAAMQARGTYLGDKAKRINTDQAVAAFNSSYIGTYLKDSVDNYHRGVKLQQERKEAIERGDFFTAKELEQDYLHSYLAPRVKYGRFDLVQEEANDLMQLMADDASFEQLQSEGKIPEGITKQEAMGNLTKLLNNAKALANAYETLNVRYSGQIDEKGNRVYPEEVIDKMAYANAKIQDYDRRLPLVKGNLAKAAIDFNESLDLINKLDVPTKQSVSSVLSQIDELDTTDDVKDQLKEEYADLVEMSQRRQEFIKEYNNMKNNPKDYEDIEAGVRFVPETSVRLGEKDFELGKTYTLEAPYASKNQSSGLELFPEVKVTGILGNQVKVQYPNGRETYLTRKEFSRYKEAFEGENPYKGLTKEINEGLNKLTSDKLPANFKDLSLDDKIAAINSVRSTNLQKEAKAAIDEAVNEFKNRRQAELEVLANDKLNSQIESSQRDLSSQAGDPPDLETNTPDQTEEEFNKKPHISRIAHTSYRATDIKDYNKREQSLLNNLASRTDRSNFKIVPVTKSNEAIFGLEGIVDEALAGFVPEVGQEPILFLYVKKEGPNWFFSDDKGNSLQKIEKGKPAPKDKVVYGMATNSKLTSPYYKGGERYSGKDQEVFAKVWNEERQKMLKSTSFVPYDFEISLGVPTKESPKPITEHLPKNSNLSQEGLVTIATTGPIIMPSGEGIKTPFGRPFFKFGSNLFWADNRKLSSNEKENIKKSLKELTRELQKKPASWDKLLTSYLQGVLYFTAPYDKNGNKRKVSNGQIWFEKGQWIFGENEDKFPFRPESFDNPEYMAKLDTFLENAYIRVNNTKLKEKQKFFEVTGFDEKGEPTVKQWNSYQEFLISPEGRKTSDIPLTTKVTGLENRYSWLPKVTEGVKIVEEQPEVKSQSSSSQSTQTNAWGEKVLGGGSISDILSGKKPEQPAQPKPTVEQKPVQPSSNLTPFEKAMLVLQNNIAEAQGTEATQSEKVEPTSGVFTPTTPYGTPKGEPLVTSTSDIEGTQPAQEKTQDQNRDEIKAKIEAAKKARAEGRGPKPDAQNKIVNATNYVVGNMEKEKEYISERLNVPVTVVQNLIDNLQGGYAWGQFRDAAIYLYENAEVGTGYHEAFEAVWAMFTSLPEKKNILSEFRGRTGSFLDRETGKAVKYSEATEYQAKEELAEEFSRFVQNGEVVPKGKKNFIQRFFAALKNFIQNVILGRVTTPEQFFKRIDSGYYKNAPVVNSSNFNQVANKIPGLGQLDSHNVVRGVAAKVFQDVFSDASNTSLVEFEEGTSTVNEIFDRVYQRLEDMYESDEGIINALLEQGKSENEIYSVMHVWQNVKDNWPRIVALTKEYLATFNLVAKSLEDNSQLLDNEDSVEENKEGEETTYDGKADSYRRDVFKLDAKQNAPMSVKLLFATIIDSEFTGEMLDGGIKEVAGKRDNATAMEKMVQYAKMFNNSLAELGSLNTLSEKLARLNELAETFPNYTRLINRLKVNRSVDNLTPDDWKLRIKLFSTMSKQRPTAFIYRIDPEGNAYSIVANQADAKKAIVQSWLDGMKLKSEKPNSFVKFDSSKKRFEVDKDVLKRIPISDQDSKKEKELRIKFLEKLGIIFSDEMLNSLTSKDTQKLHEAILGLHTGFVRGETIAYSASSLEASGRLSSIAEIFMKSQTYGEESTYFNIEGERVQEFVQPNFISNTVNDINNAKDVNDLYAKLPYLQRLWHQGSVYLAPNKFIPKFSIEYIQGIRDLRNDFRPNIPTSKLNEGMRLLQEFNQNLRGSYYTLIPADSQTEWMVAMDNPITLEGVNNIGWSNFYETFEKYYEVEKQLFELDGKKRLLHEFGGYTEPMNREALKASVMEAVKGQVRLLEDYNQILPKKKGGETVYSIKGFDVQFLEKKKINPDQVTESELTELFLFRTMNYMINNVEMHKIFYGDPASYGSIENMTKRYKSFLSPRETSVYSSPEINEFLDREYNKAGSIRLNPNLPGYQEYKDNMTTVTMEDVNVTGLYDESNSTDGQSWATLSAYREIRQKAGFRWKKADEIQYQYIQALDRQLMFEDGLLSEDIYPEELRKQDAKIVNEGDPEVAAFNVLKPIGSGFTAENDVFLDKTSVVPLSYSLVRGRNLATVYKKMLDEKIDYLIVKSGRKVGNKGTDKFYNEDGSVNTNPYQNIVEVPFRYYGIQVETTNTKDSVTRGSQLTKEAVINLFENGKPKSEEIGELVKENIAILREMANEGYTRLLDKLGIVEEDGRFEVVDKEKLLKVVKDELLRREVADNIREALKLDPETNDLVVPFEALNNYQQIKNILFSFVDKYITSPKVSGGGKIQVSGALWEMLGVKEIKTKDGNKVLVSSGLKFYENEDGKRYIEVLMPSWMNKTLREAGLEWKDENELMEKIKQSPDAQDILSGIGFRIPTQEINSAEVFVIKGFLPSFAGDTVVVPEEITTKAGSDFDVDKLNSYLKNVYVDGNGQIRTYKYFETMEEHDAYYKEEFKKILARDYRKAQKSIDTQSKLQSVFGKLMLGQLSSKQQTKWEQIFGEWFQDMSAEEVEQLFIDRLSRLGKKVSELTDSDLQEVALWKFVDTARKKSLENAYLNSLNKLLSHPDNFERLTTPNTTKTLTAIRKTLVGISEEEFGEGSVKSILNPLFMSKVRHNFIVGKGGVGIAAVAQTGNAVRQLSTIYIDTRRIKNVKDSNKRAILGNGRIMLPNNQIQVEGYLVTSLSSIKDRAGQYISDKISEYINGYVDIAKDAFIVQIGATIDQAGTFLLLESAGVPSETVAYFMNQPIIREYLKALKLREIGEFKSDVLEATVKKFAVPSGSTIPKEFPDAQKVDKLNNHLLKNLRNYYQNNQPVDNAEQQFILNEYLKYNEIASQLFNFTQGTNYDTSAFSDSNLILRKDIQEKTAREESIISSVDEFLGNSFIGTTKDRVKDATTGVSSIFKFTVPRVIKAIAPIVERLTKNIYSPKEFLKSARKVEVSLIDFLIQNSTKLNNNITRLLLNEQTSVAQELANAKELKGDIANNVILKELVPMVGSSLSQEKNVKLINKAYDAFTSNLYTDSLRELRDNPHTQQLYGNLLRIAFIQSGISKSPISFADVIPVEDYKKLIEPAIQALENTELLDRFIKTDAFYRNNWRDDSIVPYQQDRKIELDDMFDASMFPDYTPIYEYKDRFESPALSNLVQNDPNFIAWKVHEKGRNFDRKFIKVRVINEKFTPKERAQMAKEGDFSFMKTYFLKRVEFEDGTPATWKKGKWKYAIFVPAFAWGKGINAQEYYADIVPSVLDNGTYKPTMVIPIDGEPQRVYKELTNTQVINALGLAHPDGRTIFNTAYQPAVEEQSNITNMVTTEVQPKKLEQPIPVEKKEVIEKQKVELFKGFWTRNFVEKQSDKVFLFGDNTNDRLNTKYIPTSTQAVIRGLSNAIGIDTKKDRGTKNSSYFTDSDFEIFKKQTDEAIQKAKDSGKTIVIPEDGIGTGKAMLKEKAPKLFEYLQQQLRSLSRLSISNDILPENRITKDCN